MASRIETAPTAAPAGRTERVMRADAQRNVDKLLQIAKEVFLTDGVDAPVRTIAAKAGVGIATIYRHFPQRTDLITAVFHREIDSCADAAVKLTKNHAPFEALAAWMQQYAAFVGTKRGMAPALHSASAALGPLREHFNERMRPALQSLLRAAARDMRTDVDADELLTAVASLCMPHGDIGPGYTRRMTALLIEGLRQPADRPSPQTHKRSRSPTRT